MLTYIWLRNDPCLHNFDVRYESVTHGRRARNGLEITVTAARAHLTP